MSDFDKLVEGYLNGVSVCKEERTVKLSLREPTGKNWTLTASDVSEMMVLEMRMQNIIDRIVIRDKSSKDCNYRDDVFLLVNGRAAGVDDDLNSRSINEIIDTINSGDAVLFKLEPVYGAIVIFLAGAVQFFSA